MRRIGSRLMVVLVAATIGLVGAGAPAHGALDQPDDWVVWAAGKNWTILDEFTAAVGLPCPTITMAELNSARAAADSELDVVWNTATSGIDGLVEDGVALAGDAAAAKALLLVDHENAHDDLSTYYAIATDAMGSCAPTTTTTTTPGTTTTQSPTTTSSTTTTVPRSTTSSTTSTTTTTTTEPTTTTTRPTEVVFVGEPPDDRGGTAIRSEEPVSTPQESTGQRAMADPAIGVDDALTSALVFDAGGIVTNDGMADSVTEGMAHTGIISGMFTAGASVLLPPGLVQKAVGPIIAMEFLVRTLIDSLGTMIVPLTVFLMAAGFVLWRESRRSAPIAG